MRRGIRPVSSRIVPTSWRRGVSSIRRNGRVLGNQLDQQHAFAYQVDQEPDQPEMKPFGKVQCYSKPLRHPRLKQRVAHHQQEQFQLDRQIHNTLQLIDRNVIGANCAFDAPFGKKYVAYADFTASGKSLACIEEFIHSQVLPLYGNTHTTSSVTGLQSTSFREEARSIIAKAVHAETTSGHAKDAVLFTGQGSTAAIHKFVSALGLNRQAKSRIKKNRPVVFVGPFEHHANLLPWRESCADVVQIPEDQDGRVDLEVLADQLRKYANRPLKIGSFSAASNLTGVLTDVNKVAAVLHQHGALACFDYAMCAPYVAIDMNPQVDDPALKPYVYKDAVFFSGHKFVGGPGSPGVLVVKRKWIDNPVPTVPAGGTVQFVTKSMHSYTNDLIEREEGGTPDVIGAIRLGLAFQMKQSVGTDAIMAIERHHAKTIHQRFDAHPNIYVLGKAELDHLPVFSFLIRFGQRFLHFNFVSALLNDLFGIQTRGGCQCAGPYAARILGVSDESMQALATPLAVRNETILKPGFTRISFPYFLSEDQVQYMLSAIEFVAEHGWRFLPLYHFDKTNGAWIHQSRATATGTVASSCMNFASKKFLASFDPAHEEDHHAIVLNNAKPHYQESLDQANFLASQMRQYDLSANAATRDQVYAQNKLHDRSEPLRWFVYPQEVYELLPKDQHELPPIYRQQSRPKEMLGVFQPHRYWQRGGGVEHVNVFAAQHTSEEAEDHARHPVRTHRHRSPREIPGITIALPKQHQHHKSKKSHREESDKRIDDAVKQLIMMPTVFGVPGSTGQLPL